ncbi:60S ribosomal protein L31 [Ceratobasidium theobromae]|uniref:60S ribosomal protein L31 n=1 Tax=Ceratobasidium theobromae TaxID=1582974 RepID=A0A5N5QNX8_9AGAM|nr:60S ribosomal protein L31 [Ceratobasidium theobromae]
MLTAETPNMADIPYTISSYFLELTSTTLRSPPLSDLLPVSCHHRQDLPRSNPMTGKTRSALQDVVTREYTIHLHKHVHGHSFKKRAPKAVKAVITFAQKAMGVKDVRLDPKLNQELWKQGIKNVPHRVRVKLERKRNDEEDAKEKLYVYASHLPVASFKGLQTVIADVE